MTAIVNLPDEPRFTIKAVAWQTGIRPVTLRAWERRHDVLNPHRNSNHYRLYSERDIAILRWLKHKVDEGVPISNAINELRRMATNNIWPEAIPLIPSPAPEQTSTPPEFYTRQLFRALVKHDENAASSLLHEMHGRFDLVAIFKDILVPLVNQISLARYRGEIDVPVERFASSYLRCKLLSLLQAYPFRHNGPRILIGNAPMETNELESLMLAVLLRSQGSRVEYLGPDIALEDLADYARYELPAMVILSASSEFTAHEMRSMQKLLKGVRSQPVFGFIGSAFAKNLALRKEIPGSFLGIDLMEAQETVKSLLKANRKISSAAHK